MALVCVHRTGRRSFEIFYNGLNVIYGSFFPLSGFVQAVSFFIFRSLTSIIVASTRTHRSLFHLISAIHNLNITHLSNSRGPLYLIRGISQRSIAVTSNLPSPRFLNFTLFFVASLSWLCSFGICNNAVYGLPCRLSCIGPLVLDKMGFWLGGRLQYHDI